MLLDTLPIELLPNVFTHMSAEDLWFRLRPVNPTMNQTLKQPNYWMKRAKERFGLLLPDRLKTTNAESDGPSTSGSENSLSVQTIENIDLDKERNNFMPLFRCVALERAATRWAPLPGSVSKPEAHIATIDALRLFRANHKLFCLSGSRDRQIKLWDMQTATNLEDPSTNRWECTTIDKAHGGWVWSLSLGQSGEAFYSAGWDSLVKQWRIAEAQILPLLQLQMEEAALCCVAEGDHLLFVSTHRQGPLLYDTRAGPQPQAAQHCHGHRAVFELATGPDSNQIYSIGEDCQLIAVDKRNFERVSAVHHCAKSISHVDYAEGQLCLSQRNGQLLFFRPDNLQLENELKITNEDGADLLGHQYVKITRGATFCACSDNQLRVYSPGLNPRLLANIDLIGSVTRLDVLGRQAVVAHNLGGLTFWP